MLSDDYKLDNPVWHSLSETHQQYAVEYNTLKFYHPDYCPFGGTVASSDIAQSLATYATLCDNFFVVGEQPGLPSSLSLHKELVCNQMIIHNAISFIPTEEVIKLDERYTADLLALVNLVQPGYFKNKTAALGNYYGIFKDNELVAVTGERMQMHAYTEVSAVVTHPEHTGRGYAKQLIAHAVNNIIASGKTPYLHVAESNSNAIRLYKNLGFVVRRKMSFWNIVK